MSRAGRRCCLEPLTAEPQQPHPPPRDTGSGEQRPGRNEQAVGGVFPFGERVAAGDRGEVVEAHLERHGSGPHPRRPQPGGEAVGVAHQFAIDEVGLVQVVLVGDLD